MVKRTKRRTTLGRRKKAGLRKPLLFFLLAMVLLGGIALMVGYYVASKEDKPKPVVKDLTLVQTETEAVSDVEKKQQETKIQQQKEAVTSPLQGHTWVSTLNGAMLTVEGNRYTIDFPSVEDRQPMMGAITFSKNGFTVTNHQGDDPCENKPGTYTFRLDGEDVVIEAKSDPCRTRSFQLQAGWFRL